MPFVSVIVPAYNAEYTIKNTIKDILCQTFKDFELILVDDGSNDRTGMICDIICRKDSRIRVLHQINGGLSNARNNGTKKAIGQFVTYIDSDDRVDKYYLEYMVRALEETNADIACGRIDRVRDGYSLPLINVNYSVEVYDNKDTIREMLLGRKLTVGACCRLVPREWQLRYPFIEGTYYEDLSNTYKINMLATRTAFVDSVLYHYVMRGGSITGRKVTTAKQCHDYYNAIKMCCDTLKKEYKELRDDVAVLKARDYMSLYLSINRCNELDEELTGYKQIIVKWIKSNWTRVTKNARASKEIRLRTLLFNISPKLYEYVYYIGIKAKGKKIG